MGRRAKCGYWKSEQAYCTRVGGRFHVLARGPDDSAENGPCYTAACARFSELVEDTAPAPAATGLALSEVVQQYLTAIQPDAAPDTHDIYRRRLRALCLEFGDTPVSALTSLALQQFCHRHRPPWSNGTIRLTLSITKACLRWASGNLPDCPYPLQKIKLPKCGTRGLEVNLTDEQERTVLNSCRQPLKDLVIFLAGTGCRPAEARRAEARHFDGSIPAIVFPAIGSDGKGAWKCGRKSGKPRVIYLAGGALDIVKRLARERPSGPLFLSGRRKQKGVHKGQQGGWDGRALVAAFQILQERTGIQTLTAYSFRHTYCIRALRSGVHAVQLAILMGTSLKQIIDTYGHLAQQHDYLSGIAASLAR